MHRLVNGTKKPTLPPIAVIDAELAEIARQDKEARSLDACRAALAFDGIIAEEPAGRWARLSGEQWRAMRRHQESGALYTPLKAGDIPRRAVLITQVLGKSKPPVNFGDRWTDRLTPAAQKKISDAATYAHLSGNGFKTFCTLTLNQAQRDQLAAWDCAAPDDPTRRTLGALVSDFLKAVKMAWARGMVLRDDNGARVGRLRPHSAPFVFAWVAECPMNADGEPNPHVHLMFNWRVLRKHFSAWAAWLEKTWGGGFAKLEKLRKPQSAAAYMSKAAKYMAKGTDGSQGRIRGNRYGIATACRAPAARSLGTFFAGNLREVLRLMHTARDKLRELGAWCGAHAFGTRKASAWARLWQAIKRDGFGFEAAPPDLHNTRRHNAEIRAAQIREADRAEWVCIENRYTDENWKSLFNVYQQWEVMQCH